MLLSIRPADCSEYVKSSREARGNKQPNGRNPQSDHDACLREGFCLLMPHRINTVCRTIEGIGTKIRIACELNRIFGEEAANGGVVVRLCNIAK